MATLLLILKNKLKNNIIMKKNYLFALGAASMLLMSSCQNDSMPTGADAVPVRFSVALPEMQSATRAFGDGETAKVLHYGVFETFDDNNDGAIDRRVYLKEISSATTGTKEIANKKAYVTLTLMPKSNYEVCFWAASSEAPYEVSFANDEAKVTVNTAKLFSNNENNDAFFGKGTITNLGFDNGQIIEVGSVVLKRPFAQLNIGTADYEAAANAGFKVDRTEVLIKHGVVCESLNLFNGEASSNTKNIRYTVNTIPTEAFPVANYKYISMNYLLVTADAQLAQETDAITLRYYSGDRYKERTFSQVPVRRNWRTNIYGELLTSNVGISVSIDPFFADENSVDDDKDGIVDNEWYNEPQK